MKTYKRLLSFAVCLVIVLSGVAVIPGGFTAQGADITAKVAALKAKFPDGKYWNHVGSSRNNPDKCTSTPCTHHGSRGSGCSISDSGCACNFFNGGIQCVGYSYKIAYELTGSLPSVSNGWTKTTTLSASKLAVGDIIRYLNNSHSICVVGVNGNTIAYTGANWGGNCLIRWGTMTISQLTGFTYVYHKSNNSDSNSDLSIVSGATSEIWKTKTSNDSSLNIRKSASTSSSVVGNIPPGKKFEVLSKTYSTTTKYLWAKIKYKSIKGFCVLNYAQYVKGSVETINLINLSDIYSGISYTLNWNAIDGADTYKLYLYNSSGRLTKSYTCYSTSRAIKIADAGEYYIRLVAKNSRVSSWKVESGKIAVTVFASGQLKLSSISLPDSMNIRVGQSEYCDFEISPYAAMNDMKWSTSDSSVATVSSAGVVQAKKCGKVKISCQSKSKAKIISSCEVTVLPPIVSGLRQVSLSDTSKIQIKWNEVKNIDGYRVYSVSSDGKIYKKLVDVKKTSYTFNSTSGAGQKIFSVRAYKAIDGKRYYSPYPTPLKTYIVPGKVQGLKCVSQTTAGFKLKWTAVKGANAYDVYRYSVATKQWDRVLIVKKNSASFGSITDNSAYSYRVRAVLSHDGTRLSGEPSDSVYGFCAPMAPVLSATPGKTSVTLRWTRPAGTTGYRLLINTASGYKQIATPRTTSTAYTVTGLRSGRTYTFKLEAIAEHGGASVKSVSKPLDVRTK